MTNGGVVRYQCHVGHQYAEENLDAEQRDKVDSALWTAVRVLEEQAALKMRMASRAGQQGLSAVSAGFSERARDAHEQAQLIRAALFANGNKTTRSPAPAADAEPRRMARRRPNTKRPGRKRSAKRKT